MKLVLELFIHLLQLFLFCIGFTSELVHNVDALFQDFIFVAQLLEFFLNILVILQGNSLLGTFIVFEALLNYTSRGIEIRILL